MTTRNGRISSLSRVGLRMVRLFLLASRKPGQRHYTNTCLYQ